MRRSYRDHVFACDLICLRCSREGGTRVHPGSVPGHGVGGAGRVPRHVGGADGGPDGGARPRPPGHAPRHAPAQVRLDGGVPILFFAVDFSEKIPGTAIVLWTKFGKFLAEGNKTDTKRGVG